MGIRRHGLNYRQLLPGLLMFCGNVGGAVGGDNPVTARLWRELEPAWEVVEQKVAGLVGGARQRLMTDLVYASVAANVCSGLALKADEFKQAFNVFEDGKYQAMHELERKQYEQQLLIHYGTFLGLLTAEALLNREEFCTAATHLKASGGGAFWDARPELR